MLKIDLILAVKEVKASAKWYESVFGWKRVQGGDDFATLISENKEVLLCLNAWEEHEHPTMIDPASMPGSGLILHFRTDAMNAIRQNIEKMDAAVEEDIHLNPNSGKLEFSVGDPDGYYLTITEYHTYEG
ncbi:MAG: VOC family protein [Maribacter sp.]|nr:VOC family protein [Maribacter sp.]